MPGRGGPRYSELDKAHKGIDAAQILTGTTVLLGGALALSEAPFAIATTAVVLGGAIAIDGATGSNLAQGIKKGATNLLKRAHILSP